jgi:ribosomal RNA-processing protein 17
MADFKVFNHPRPKKSVLPPLPKKRKTEHKIEEINFDFDKREDYLTGFHKRKVARIKQAQAEAEKKAREERTELRKTVCWMLAIPSPLPHNSDCILALESNYANSNLQLREERKKELEQHVDAVNALVGNTRTSDQEGASGDEVWGGIEDEIEPEAVDHEEEYIDEDRYTTVTVEAVDISKDGLHRVVDDSDSEPAEDVVAKPDEKVSQAKKKWPKKEKKKKFRYESKAERKVTRSKQKAGNKAKADARKDR